MRLEVWEEAWESKELRIYFKKMKMMISSEDDGKISRER